MRSTLPKVLHPLAGRPLLAHVLNAARALKPRQIFVVHGYGGAEVRAAFNGARVTWVEQSRRLGTGHAVMQALPRLRRGADVLVLNGDVPMVRPGTLARLAAAAKSGLAICTSDLADASGYGRVVRDAKRRVRRIVEQADASPRELAIREWYAGFLAAPAARLSAWLARVKAGNTQKEYYLTDVIALAAQEGVAIATVKPEDPWEVAGVNSRHELALIERAYQNGQAKRLLDAGVALADLWRVDVRGELS